MKAYVLILVFCLANLFALFDPMIGVLGYMANYLVSPEQEWWGQPLQNLGVRQSLTLVIATGIGLALAWGKLRRQIMGPVLNTQELLACVFVVVVLTSRLWGVPINHSARSLTAVSQLPAEKIVKLMIFAFMMTHIVNSYRQLNWVFWMLIVAGGLYIGFDGYTASPGRFVKGRLDSLGGADFREANSGSIHLAYVGAVTAVMLFKTRRWYLKALCLVTGAFSANAIIMTQSRGAMVGVSVGVLLSIILAPKGYRSRIFGGVVLAAIGFLSLTNKTFWERSETISANPTEGSAASRYELWSAGFRMFLDHPLGVGAGSFYTVVGDYDYRHVGKDCHNMYVRCLAELGVPGGAVLFLLIINAFRILARAPRLAAGTEIEHFVRWDSFGLRVGLAMYLTGLIFISGEYVEETWWWLLCLPVCLERAVLGACGGRRTEHPNCKPLGVHATA